MSTQEKKNLQEPQGNKPETITRTGDETSDVYMNSELLLKIAKCFDIGNGNLEHDKEAFKWCKKAADKGNVEAQLKLGLCYNYGIGVEQDYKESSKWFKNVADLGKPYNPPESPPTDYWDRFLERAEEGDVYPQYTLACNFYYGGEYSNGDIKYVVEQNYKEASKWFKKVADKVVMKL